MQELLSPGYLIFYATLLAAVSGAPLVLLRFISATKAQLLSAIVMCVASVTGLVGAVTSLLGGGSLLYELAWHLPFGAIMFGIDPLTCWFLLPIFLIPGCSAVYACLYWHADSNAATVRRMTFFFGLMAASMSCVVLSRDGISFLFAWEIMALAAYFLISTEDDSEEVHQAGLLYMVTTHSGTLALFALFPLLNMLTGSWGFPASSSLDATGGYGAIIFLAAIIGFGMKAGVMPLHIWLPSAHANAPSHVSAVMSGVILKVGIYGIIRLLSFFKTIPLWWGFSMLLLGVVSAVIGVAFAIGQHDLKRLLAYHSIENIGIIYMGLGVALIGQATGSAAMMLLGMSGALLHVLNHALFKALLFFGAGSIIHSVGTRDIDLMGGVARRLPYTALLFGVGSVAICGLPPLNGFVSELLLYLGFFQGVQGEGSSAAAMALAAPALALVGGLAVACFVKVYGVVFSGMPRTDHGVNGHEAGWPMLVPMLFLGILCAVIGLLPWLITDQLQLTSLSVLPRIVTTGGLQLHELFPGKMVTITGAALMVIIVVLAIWYRRTLASAPSATNATWGCGYQRPAARMQYTASSFADTLISIFSFALKPSVHQPENISGLFPAASRFTKHVPEVVLEILCIPFLDRLYHRFGGVRKLQSGVLQQYVFYSLLTLVVLLVASFF